ncbi:gliding motility-associated C-terminal domain-containing protein [Hymenobacter lutimineralis]|uniref:Gliding motility-associated C-terminal domain-containing protein n=1 Tax=Hymenobacter lutimineralis TaxID=2606448 RepID=A0A5D6UZ80_9BACT|nr:gliding motility-associated C-terminal domain-containing protein [Hymenobacter lutimineralis]TYZ08108.1 gliding motility-associated C-terminal domain-containing protein [Hymenobacter lutimineralis]
MIRLILLVWACCLLLLPGRSYATHIVGGEMGMQHLRDSTYVLNLVVYFDAVNGDPGALDQSLTAAIYEKGTNRFVEELPLPLLQNTLVDYSDPACSNASLTTRRLIYARELVLHRKQYRSLNGYYATVERCCRNRVIANIQNPGAAGQAFLVEFPGVVQANGEAFRNSSPSLFPPLSDYACKGELFYYDFGGQDPDGDQLVYEMVTPLNGHSTSGDPKPDRPASAPYSLVRWRTGLSEDKQIPGTPNLRIDAQTGRLEVLPTELGLFVFGIKCSEYRNGVKIGEVRRDFQMLIINCPRNQAPQLQVEAQGQVLPHTPTGTLAFAAGEARCFQLRFTDPDAASRLKLSMRAVNFSEKLPTPTVTTGTVRSPGNPDVLVSTVCFPKCFNTQGKVYQLEFIVADNGCSLPKLDTVRVAFSAAAPPDQPPTLLTTAQLPLRVHPGDVVKFAAIGQDPDQDQLSLTMRGLGFEAAPLGATLGLTTSAGEVRGDFSWTVPCAAIDRGLHEFEFLLTSTSECYAVQTQRLVIPIVVEYENEAPELTSTFPTSSPVPEAPPVVVTLPLGGIYEATLLGTDADPNDLTMTAAGKNMDLASMGMQFTHQDGRGKATGTFRWEATCAALENQPLEVTFTLQESTCRPQPRQQTVRFEVLRPASPAFLPPNIFTPNADGKNNRFELGNVLPPDLCNNRFGDIKIFNRWGTQVYRSQNRSFSWDGGGLPEGVYYYLIEFTNKTRFKGTITIAR